MSNNVDHVIVQVYSINFQAPSSRKLSLERSNLIAHFVVIFHEKSPGTCLYLLLHMKNISILSRLKFQTRANVYQQVCYMANGDSQFGNKNYCRCGRSFKREMSGEAWRYKQAICILCEYYATTTRFVRLLFTSEKRVYYAST